MPNISANSMREAAKRRMEFYKRNSVGTKVPAIEGKVGTAKNRGAKRA